MNNAYYLMWFKEKLTVENDIEKEVFIPGDVAFTSYRGASNFAKQIAKLNRQNAIQFFNVKDFFKRYDHKEKGGFTTLIVRTGGIGDIISLSTMCNQIKGKVVFWTQKKYFDCFDYFDKKVEAKHMFGKVFTGMTFAKMMQIQRTYRIVDFEGVIENGSDRNWYDIYYDQMNIQVDPNRRRPELRDPSGENTRSYVLLCPRSSCNMRSMHFSDLYKAVIKVPELNGLEIRVHDSVLMPIDLAFISNYAKDVKIIHADTTGDYLYDLARSTITISVDSAPVHFREGLRLPAIGIYNAFTAASRTDGYKFTYSRDIASKCPKQPCFKHQWQAGKLTQNCEFAREKLIAPCFGHLTPNLHQQLVNIIYNGLRELEAKELSYLYEQG